MAPRPPQPGRAQRQCEVPLLRGVEPAAPVFRPPTPAVPCEPAFADALCQGQHALPSEVRRIIATFVPEHASQRRVNRGTWAARRVPSFGRFRLPAKFSGEWARELAFAPDGLRLLCRTAAIGVVVFDTVSGAPLGILPGPATTASWSADGASVVTTRSSPASAQVWSIPSTPSSTRVPELEPERTLALPARHGCSSLLAGDYAIATAGIGEPLVMTSLATGARVHTQPLPEGGASALAASKDPGFLVTAWGRTLRVWSYQPRGLHLVHELDAGEPIESLAISPNAKFVAARSKRATRIRVWKLSGPATLICTLPGTLCDRLKLLMSPTGSCLLAPCDDGSLRLWDSRTGARLPAVKTGFSWLHCVDWSPDGKHLAYAGNATSSDGMTIHIHVFRVGGFESDRSGELAAETELALSLA